MVPSPEDHDMLRLRRLVSRNNGGLPERVNLSGGPSDHLPVMGLGGDATRGMAMDMLTCIECTSKPPNKRPTYLSA